MLRVTLKRLPRAEGFKCPPLRLYLDDVAYLAQVMKQINGEVEIAVDHQTTGDVTDLASMDSKRPNRMSITSRDRDHWPEASIDMDRDGFKVKFRDVGEHSMQFTTLETFLGRKQRKFAKLARSGKVILTALVLGGINLVFALTSFRQAPNWLETTSTIFAFAFLVAVITNLVMTSRPHSIVILQSKADAPSWLQRNRDSLVINAGFLVVGAVLGALVSHFMFPASK